MRILKGISEKTSDHELLKKFSKTGDMDYLAELFSRYAHLIFAVSMKYLQSREDAEDMSIKVFEVLARKISDQDIANIGGWIHVVTKNECLMQIRSSSRAKQREIIFAEDVENEPVQHHMSETDVEESLRKLEDCINSLVKEQKQCVELFYKQEKCYKEIANLTGYELKKVKSYLQNGKRNLTNCMNK